MTGTPASDDEPEADSRGQELRPQRDRRCRRRWWSMPTWATTPPPWGARRCSPTGTLTFTSGFQGSASGSFGQSIEVLPNGSTTYVQTMTGYEYRSYFMSTLYGRPADLLKTDTTTQGTWIGTYGAQGYDVVGGPSSLPGYATVTPSGQSTYVWTASSTDPRALQVPGRRPRRRRLVLRLQLQVDVNLIDGRSTTSSCTSPTGTTRAGPRRCRSATRRRAPC